MAKSEAFQLEINGDVQVKLAVTRVSGASEDMSAKVGSNPSLWDRWHKAFFAAEIDLFASHGASGKSGAWPALSPKYAAWKARVFPGRPIMRATGAMMQSLVKTGPGHVFKPTSTSLEIGTNEKAGWHWEAVGNRPARKAIDIGPKAEREYFGRALVEWGNDLRKEWAK